MRKLIQIFVITIFLSKLQANIIQTATLTSDIKPSGSTYEDMADLLAINIKFDLDTVVEYESCKITFQLQNIGTLDAGEHFLAAYISTDGDTDISDDFFVEEFSISGLQANYYGNGWFDVVMFPNLGSDIYNVAIVVVVDSKNQVVESDENNTFVTDIIFPVKNKELPDLFVKDVMFAADTVYENDAAVINFYIQNLGYGPADSSHVECYLSVDGDTDISDDYFVERLTVPALQARYQAKGWFDILNFPDLGIGIYEVWIVVIVDSDDEIMETDETSIYVTETSFIASDPKPTKIQDEYELPTHYSISQNYPNPFNPVTNINFQLPKQSFVNISIYDLAGNLVEEIVNKTSEAGYHAVTWDANSYPSGVYLYKITTPEFQTVKQCVLIK